MKTCIDFVRVLDDIAHLLGDELPGSPARIPAGSRAVADHLHVKRSTIMRWWSGAEPRHLDGELVLEHWTKLTGKDRAFAPRERVSKQQKQAVAVKLEEGRAGAAKVASAKGAGVSLQNVWGAKIFGGDDHDD